MIGLLRAAAAAQPGDVAVVGPSGQATWADLHDEALRVAAALSDRSLTRFGIVETDVARVIPLLAGAALVGAEPCQYPGDVSPAELADHAGELGHDVVVTTRTDLGDIEVLTPADLAAASQVPADGPVPERQPLLIRTTGTTGRPKAARHDWAILARAVARVEPQPGRRWLLAYGPHQFAGTQVLLHAVAAQATLVAPFPRQPRDGLRALRDHGVTCVSATPTYWRFLLVEARGSGATLPPLEQVTLGGEAAPADLLADLARAFPTARISHVYASTEFGSVVSVSDGRPGLSVDALLGDHNPDARLRVVDDELWVRVGAGMLEYAASAEPPGDVPAELAGWRPTGDTVEVVDGRVYFRGRASEIINVGGVKVHPLPVEDRIVALPGIGAARVYGRANRLMGHVVAVDVVLDGDRADLAADVDRLRDAIDAAVADLPAAWRPRSVKVVDEIETRGGKIARLD